MGVCVMKALCVIDIAVLYNMQEVIRDILSMWMDDDEDPVQMFHLIKKC